jgi:uncharacterized protein (TIGR02271 family)
MYTETKIDQCVGRTLHDRDGNKIGEIKDVYLDEETGKPEWFAVSTGFFGSKLGFVPVQGSSFNADEQIMVGFTKDEVKRAPHVEADGRLTQDEEAELYAHYSMGYSERRSGSGLPDQRQAAPTAKRRGGDDAMTRSEEEIEVGKRQQAVGKARLRKVVETEHKTVTVPIQRERVEVVTEPITDANRDKAMKGPDITESVHEETLYEEVPVVEKKVVPKERVKLQKETTTDKEQVEADLRKERIEVDDDGRTKR